MLSSVKPKQAAKRLNASRLFSGIRAYMLLIGVLLFIAFCISFFFISFLLPYVCSSCTHTATDERTSTSFPLYHPYVLNFFSIRSDIKCLAYMSGQMPALMPHDFSNSFAEEVMAITITVFRSRKLEYVTPVFILPELIFSYAVRSISPSHPMPCISAIISVT